MAEDSWECGEVRREIAPGSSQKKLLVSFRLLHFPPLLLPTAPSPTSPSVYYPLFAAALCVMCPRQIRLPRRGP